LIRLKVENAIGHVAKEDDSKEDGSFSCKHSKDGRVGLLSQFKDLPEADCRNDNVNSPREEEVAADQLVVAGNDAGELFVAGYG